MEESAMPKPGLPRRYLIFLGGVIFTALGVALITLAGMGTSAVSSLSYVLTLCFPASPLAPLPLLSTPPW